MNKRMNGVEYSIIILKTRRNSMAAFASYRSRLLFQDFPKFDFLRFTLNVFDLFTLSWHASNKYCTCLALPNDFLNYPYFYTG